MTDHTDTSHSPMPAHEMQKSFAVYVFKDSGKEAEISGRRRLSWLRDCVCNDLSTALTKAELVRTRKDVSRVQIFEQVTDSDGRARAGRIVRTLNQSRWRELFPISQL